MFRLQSRLFFFFRLKLVGMMDREYLRAQCLEQAGASRTSADNYIPSDVLRHAVTPISSEIHQVCAQLSYHCNTNTQQML
jgi:hypothetical protein